MENPREFQAVQIEAGSASGEKTDVFRKRSLFSCSPFCSFSVLKGSRKSEQSKTALKLCGLILLYSVVMAAEIYGGLRANSLAILTDAADVLSDITGFFVSLLAVWISAWEATPKQSFGYSRVEVIGALLSVQLIWLISIILIYEAIHRLTTKSSRIDGRLMCGVAAFGFAFNLLIVYFLGHDHSHHGHSHLECNTDDDNPATGGGGDEEEGAQLVSNQGTMERLNKLNINIQGAYLHIITDMFQSFGVLIAGIVIWIKPEWLMVDLICTLIFTTIALGTTLPMLRKVASILMERAPSGIDADRVSNHVKLVGGVYDVHDLHVWAITFGKHAMTCHIRIGRGVDSNEILRNVREHIEHEFGIHHVTIQIEQES